eukprot:260934-Alexandrium_andersonii.AAC.1
MCIRDSLLLLLGIEVQGGALRLNHCGSRTDPQQPNGLQPRHVQPLPGGQHQVGRLVEECDSERRVSPKAEGR